MNVTKKNFFCVCTTLLLFLSFPKTDAWFLAWIAYVPLLSVILLEKSAKKAFAEGFFSHVVFYSLLLWWVAFVPHIGSMGMPAVLALSCAESLFAAVFCAVFWNISKKILSHKSSLLRLFHAAFFSSCFFVACDYARSLGFFGFTWGSLGYTQYKNLPVIQISEWTGYHGVTFLVMFVNVCLAFFASSLCLPDKTTRTGNFYNTMPVAAFLFVLLAWFLGNVRMENFRQNVFYDETSSSTVSVAIIQGNTVRDTKWNWAYREHVFGVYETLSRQALAKKPKLLVYPERVIAYEELNDPYYNGFRFSRIAKELNVVLATGLSDSRGKGKFYNAAAVFSPSGRLLGKFHKTKLVPFGEKVPLKNLFLHFDYNPWGDWDDDSTGETFNPIETSIGNIGFNICYETTYAHISRQLVKNGAEILVGVIADSWYREVETYQHTAMFVFRAVENRRFAVRASDSGISCVITPEGKILHATKPFTRAIVHGTIQPLSTLTFYTRYGDVFVWLCVVYCMISLIFLFTNKQRANHETKK